MRWFFPSESGDIRLALIDDTHTRLEVTDPTPREIAVLTRVLKTARRKKWIPETAGIPAITGRYNLDLDVPLRDVAMVLVGQKRIPIGVISGIAYVDGSIRATLNGADMPLKARGSTPTPALPTPQDPTPAVVTPDPKPAPASVVTTPRPTLCCPNPWEGPENRASEVLRAFCSPEEWDEWQRDGMIHVQGNLTGDTYRIVHRHHPLARRQGKITWNESDDHVVHCHLSMLPPPEEVLSVKLTLQYGEDWIRNPSGYFGPGTRFPHPLGLGASEGVWSASLISGIGMHYGNGLDLLGPNPYT